MVMAMRVVRRIFRYCRIGMMAGVIGMAVGFLGYIYIMEFSERSPLLMQSAVAFNELDIISFILTVCSLLCLAATCLYIEAKSAWKNRKGDKIFKDT